jgi:hypothetical protein
MGYKLVIAAVTAVALSISFTPVAFGAASSAQVYGGGGKVIDVTPDDTPSDQNPTVDEIAKEPTKKKGSLAFTGMSVALLLGAGLVLVGVGVGSRRLTTRLQ